MRRLMRSNPALVIPQLAASEGFAVMPHPAKPGEIVCGSGNREKEPTSLSSAQAATSNRFPPFTHNGTDDVDTSNALR